MDDLLIIDNFPQIYIEMLENSFTVNPSSTGDTRSYLGDDVGKL